MDSEFCGTIGPAGSGGGAVKKKRCSVEQITSVLQHVASGVPVGDVCRQAGISEQKFVSAAMDLWAYTNGVLLDFSRRGKPTDNAAIESFTGRFREECLNVHWFASIDDAQEKIDAFRWDYNEHHPHRSLKGLSPREFAERMLQTAAGSLSE
jgi:putative transposase